MRRLVEAAGVPLMSLVVAAILAFGVGFGAAFGTLLCLMFPSARWQGLTIHDSAFWCPYLQPRATTPEEILWTFCVAVGLIIAGFVLVSIFDPLDRSEFYDTI